VTVFDDGFSGDCAEDPLGIEGEGMEGNPLLAGPLDDFCIGFDNEASLNGQWGMNDDASGLEISPEDLPEAPPAPGRAPMHETGRGLSGALLDGFPFEADLSPGLQEALLRAGLLPDEGVFQAGPGLDAQSSGEEKGPEEKGFSGAPDGHEARLNGMLDSLEESIEGSEEKPESGAQTASRQSGRDRRAAGINHAAGSASSKPSTRSNPGPHPSRHSEATLWSEPPIMVRRPRVRLKSRWKPGPGTYLRPRQRFSSASVYTWCPRLRERIPEEECIENGCEYANFEAWLESGGEEDRCTHPEYWDYMFERISGENESRDMDQGGGHEQGI